MYFALITVVILGLYKASPNEGRVTGRFRRETGRSQVEAIYSRYKQQSHGEATYYGMYPGGGACSLDPLSPLADQSGWIRVAAGRDDFQNSLGCGMCVEIIGSGKGKGSDPVTGTLRGVVHDLCGGCKQGDLDLYIKGDGRWDITIKAIDCPTLPGSDGNIMMRFTGSNPWYIKLQARNTRIPVAGIEVLKNGKYSCLRRVDDNYFIGDGLGKVDFPMQVRLTAVNGEQRETIIPTMQNDQVTTSDIQFTGYKIGGGPSTIMCMGQGNKSPYPPGGMDPGSSATSEGQTTSSVVLPPAPAPIPASRPNPSSPGNDESNNRQSDKINGTKMNERKPLTSQTERHLEGNQSAPLKVQPHSDKNVTESAAQPLFYNSKENKQTASSDVSSLRDNKLEDKEKVADSSSLHDEVHLGDTKKNDKTEDDSSREKASKSSEPVVHVMINGDRSAPPSSSSQSSDGTYKSKPSFEIMVDKDGVHARLNNNGRRGDKMDSQEPRDAGGEVHLHGRFGGEVGDPDPKPNFELTIRKNKEHVQSDKHDDGHQAPSKEDHHMDQAHEDGRQDNKENDHKESQNEHVHQNEKVVVGPSHSKENSTDAKLLVHLVPLNVQPPSTKNTSSATTASQTNTTADSKQKNEGAERNQTDTPINNQPKDIRVIKVIKVHNAVSKVGPQQPLRATLDQERKEASESLPVTAKVTLTLVHPEKSVGDLQPPHTTFNHPLDALTAYQNQHQHLVMKGKKNEESSNSTTKDSQKNDKSIKILGKEEGSGSGSGTPEEKLANRNATIPKTADHEQPKRPTLDILVKGGSDGTTELRMRTDNNEIERHSDASGKSSHDPVVGITIKQNDSPDHHIIFSKRQKLVQHNHRQHHRNDHYH